jgi:RimJ/RimL family protein N-acetyltransferase
VIPGDKVRFRPVEHDDLPRFVRWWAVPELRDNVGRFLPLSLAEEEIWFRGQQELAPPERTLVVEAQVGDEWRVIGACGLHEIDWRNRIAELGVVIGEQSEWNKGYGTDVVKTLVRHGFDALNLNRIFLRVFDDNQRGQRVYAKAGFTVEGRLRQADYRKGAYRDVLIYGMLRDDPRP